MSSPRKAVWLLNMGGPDSLETVQPFLQNLLGDPKLLQFPWYLRWFQPLFAWIISRKREREVRASYASMGGASPQLELVRDQARALQAELGQGYDCVPVFRYWGESATQAAERLQPGQPVVLLSLYPQNSITTVGSSVEDARRVLGDRPVTVIESYPQDPDYIAALVAQIRELDDDESTLLFSAHGLPISYIEAGDPYLREIEQTVGAVTAQLPNPHRLSFQSRVGVQKWLEPSSIEAIETLGKEGVTSLIVIPVAFTSDHIETLVEIGEELREVAVEAGITSFTRVDALNSRPEFIQTLAKLVRGSTDSSTDPRSHPTNEA